MSSASDPVATVGFVGIGDMGGGMARRIIDAGWPTVLWARRPEAVDEFRADNVEVAATPAELAAAVDLVGVCVWADDDVRQVVAGDGGLLAGCRPGTVVAIHSTVLPSTCRELAGHGGAEILDAPVSGGRAVALDGGLTMAVGGDEATLARCRPVFETFSGEIQHVGPLGSGQTAKLLNNALLTANVAVADEVLTLGERLGLDAASLAAFLGRGSGRSYGLDVAPGFRTSPEVRQAALPALEKDLQHLAEVAEGEGTADFLRIARDAIRRFHDLPSPAKEPS